MSSIPWRDRVGDIQDKCGYTRGVSEPAELDPFFFSRPPLPGVPDGWQSYQSVRFGSWSEHPVFTSYFMRSTLHG